MQTRVFFEFGPYTLDPSEHRLLREGQPVPLPPKAFDTLVALVGHHGHVVTKQELMDVVWPGSFVEEANLTVAVSTLRKALGDARMIETVPRRGYRFAADVREIRVAET